MAVQRFVPNFFVVPTRCTCCVLYDEPSSEKVVTFSVDISLTFHAGVYSEVGSALPLNGGAYNILLNTTTKLIAALAACLTLLSYVATAVVSGSEGKLWMKSEGEDEGCGRW